MSRVERLYDAGGGADTVKIVYVDPAGVPGTNCDFTNIPAAAAYLKGLPGLRGGIIAIKGGVTYIISAPVDLQGLTIKGVGAGWPTPIIRAATGGVLQISGTTIDNVVVSVPAGFGGTYFMDILGDGPNNFLLCDFQPATGKYIFGSSTGLTSSNMNFVNCGQSVQNGNMIDVAAVFPFLTIGVMGNNTLGVMRFGARTVTFNAEGRADSTSVATINNATFVVGPGENIQTRLNSLAALGGGMCVLLPGVYPTSTNIIIIGDNTILKGSGPTTIVRAVAPWVGGATAWDGVIMIGQKATATIVSRCRVEDIKVEQPVNANIVPGDGRGIHAFMGYGGMDNKFKDCIAEAQADLNYYVTGHVTTGFIFTDSVAEPVTRPVIENCRVQSNWVGTNKFSDAFHVEGLLYPWFTCYGHGNRAIEPVIRGCEAETIMESFLLFTGADGGELLNNECRYAPVGNTGAPIGELGCTDCMTLGNIMHFNTATGAGSICFYLDGCERSVFIGNEIDGGPNAFAWGFLINFSGLYSPNHSSNNIISHNIMRRCVTGIEITDPLVVGNIIGPNFYDYPATVTTKLVDASVTTQYSGLNRRGTGNPNGVINGNFGDCFFDTASNTQYKCTSWPQGTTWQVI